MDKSTAIKVGVGSCAAAGSVTGGYFIHKSITTSASTKTDIVQTSTTSDELKLVLNENNNDSELPPLPPSPEVSYVKPSAQENSIASTGNESYENYTLGKEFDTVLLAFNAPIEKWNSKKQLLKGGSPKSSNFKNIKAAESKITEAIKSQCQTSYFVDSSKWGSYGEGWDDTERGNFWSDVWTYCNVQENQEIPAIWPYSDLIKRGIKNI